MHHVYIYVYVRFIQCVQALFLFVCLFASLCMCVCDCISRTHTHMHEHARFTIAPFKTNWTVSLSFSLFRCISGHCLFLLENLIFFFFPHRPCGVFFACFFRFISLIEHIQCSGTNLKLNSFGIDLVLFLLFSLILFSRFLFQIIKSEKRKQFFFSFIYKLHK